MPSGKTKEKINKKNSLILQQQDNNQQPASVLPDFHQAAPDMSMLMPSSYLGSIILVELGLIMRHSLGLVPFSG